MIEYNKPLQGSLTKQHEMSSFERCSRGGFRSQLVLLPRSERGDNPICFVHFLQLPCKRPPPTVVAFKSSLCIFSYAPVFSPQTSAGMVQKPVLQPGRVHSLRFKQFSHVLRDSASTNLPSNQRPVLEAWRVGPRM